MNIQAQKAIIIEQFKQINDINLINEIKKLLESALKKDQESLDISDNHHINEEATSVEVLAVIITDRNPKIWTEKTG